MIHDIDIHNDKLSYGPEQMSWQEEKHHAIHMFLYLFLGLL